MKKLLAFFFLFAPLCLAQSWGGQSTTDSRVVPPYKFCLGQDNGKDVCFIQTGPNQATVIGTLLGVSGNANLHSPGPIGDTTPGTAAFTTTTITGVLNIAADPNGNLPQISLVPQGGISPGAAAGSIILLPNALTANGPRLGIWDGQSSLLAFITSGDVACDLLTGCTGDPTTPVALQKSPQFQTPNVDNATATSVSVPNNPDGDLFDLQPGVATPYCNKTPLASHIRACFGSDGKFQLTNDGAPRVPVLLQGPYLAADFTTANNTNLQAIGLGFSKQAKAAVSEFHCALTYSQATANAAVAFGIQAVTNSPTNINASADISTSATAKTSGTLTGLATTTATAIVSATPSATATVYRVVIDGAIEDSAHANTFNLMVSTATGADAVTVKRGSYCTF